MAQLAVDLTLKDSDGNTPLHKAFEEKNFNLVDSLLSAHVNVNANPSNTAGISHFHIACTRNNEDIVKYFLRNGASVNDCVPIDPQIEYTSYWYDIDWRGCSPLHFAVAFNMSNIVKLLLSEGADVKIQDARGFTVLHLACRSMHEKFEELIMNSLQKLKNANLVDRKNRPRMNKFFDIKKALGSLRIADIFTRDKKKVIDFMSNRNDHIEIIKMLLKYKSDVNCHDKFGNTPVFYTYMFYALDDSIFHGTYAHAAKDNFLFEMYERRQVILKMLLQHPVDLNTCHENKSILHLMVEESQETVTKAVVSGYCEMEVMKLFLRKDVNVDALNEKGLTPLFVAVQTTTNTAFIEFFIERGANVNFHEPEEGLTPLHVALQNPFNREQLIFDAVLAGGADPNAKQTDGTTVLHYLAGEFYYYPILFARLVGAGADVNARDEKGRTPLFRACLFWNDGLAKMLLRNGADINVEDKEGKTILCVLYEEKLVKEKVTEMKESIVKMATSMFNLLLDHVAKKKTTVSNKVLLSRDKIVKIMPDTRMDISD